MEGSCNINGSRVAATATATTRRLVEQLEGEPTYQHHTATGAKSGKQQQAAAGAAGTGQQQHSAAAAHSNWQQQQLQQHGG